MKIFTDGEVLEAAHLNDNFSELNEAANPKVITCPTLTGWEAAIYGPTQVTIVKQGAMAFLYGRLKRTGGPTGSYNPTPFSQLPADLHPPYDVAFLQEGGHYILIKPDGTMNAYKGGKGIIANEEININGIALPIY